MQPDTLRVALMAAAVIVVLQMAIIAVLLVRAQRDRAQVEPQEAEPVELSAEAAERQRSERENKDLLERLQRLSALLISAQDKERARIARDLHDDLSQQLAGVSISLSGLRRHIGAGAHGEELASIQQRVVALSEAVRSLSHDLHPDVLKHAGLARALSARCAELSRSQAIVATCTAEGDFESVDSETRHCLYRVAQEALHNVVKHAGARHVEVRLVRTGDAVEVSIADDGQGFDVATARRSPGGLGLLSINERVRLAGGTLSVLTEAGKGTQIRVRLPYAGVHA
jgi:two-component system sensor histidine kinase UhpB